MRRRSGLTGAAGEYYVAAELSRRGWLATVTIKNAPGTDVLAQHVETRHVIAVQTKTASQGSHFQLQEKDERLTEAKNEWYAFVALRGELERPTFLLVPRNVVAGIIYGSHRSWLSLPGRAGHVRQDSTMRNVEHPEIAGYAERWDLLEKPTSRVPFLASQAVVERVRGLPAAYQRPEGYPGFPRSLRR